MRKIHTALLAAGALALVGTAAFAAGNDVHHMTVRLADGSTAQIEYTGDVAPKVSIAPPMDLAAFAPRVAFAPFADFARIQAQMDMQMHQMMQQANAMMAMPMMNGNAPIEAAFGKMAPGAHFCAQSVRITTDAGGKQNIERHSSGDCGTAASDKPTVSDHAASPHRGTPI